VEVIAVEELDVQDFSDARIPEPRIFLVRQEVFRPAGRQPDPLAVDPGDLNVGATFIVVS